MHQRLTMYFYTLNTYAIKAYPLDLKMNLSVLAGDNLQKMCKIYRKGSVTITIKE